MKWLIPRLVQFKLRYPEIDISLLTGGGEADFKAQNIDLALRRNDFDWARPLLIVLKVKFVFPLLESNQPDPIVPPYQAESFQSHLKSDCKF